MSDTAPPRPRQVTVAAWLIMGGSVVVVLTVFERVSGLRSLETRQAVERFLAEPPGNGLGLGTEGVLDLLHAISLVAGGCAAAMAVLGYQVLHRSKPARLLLSLLAVPLFVSGLVAGGFLSSLVAAATAMLWFQPSRDWFDGISRPRPHRLDPHSPEALRGPGPAHLPGDLPRFGDAPPPGQPPGQQPGPRPVSGFGTPSAQPPRPHAPWGAGQPLLPAAPTTTEARPPALAWGCALTWLLSGLTVLLLGLLVVLTATSPDLFLDQAAFDEAQRQLTPGLQMEMPTESELLVGTALMAAMGLLWCGAASVLAVLAWRRLPWAHVSVFVMTVVSAVGCLVLTPLVFVTVLPLIGYVVAALLLWRPDVRAWFAGRGGSRP